MCVAEGFRCIHRRYCCDIGAASTAVGDDAGDEEMIKILADLLVEIG